MDKTEKEKLIACEYLKEILKDDFNSSLMRMGDHLKNEPDVLYKDIGIEIGSIIRGTSISSSKREEKFSNSVSKLIENKIPSNIQIRLVLRDCNLFEDRIVRHPFQNHTILATYFDGIFVDKYEKENINAKVVINQSSTNPNTDLPPSIKDCSIELIKYIKDLKGSDYNPWFEDSDYETHHAFTVDAKVLSKNSMNPLTEYISDSIIDKLSKKKYEGDFSNLLLILHNYESEGSSRFTSNNHFYVHYREHIIEYLKNLILKYSSFKYFKRIIFMDYSYYSRNSKAVMIFLSPKLHN